MNDLVALGIFIAIEPLPVIGFILVLSTDRGARNGAAFILGWVTCLVAIVLATMFVTGGKPLAPSSSPAAVTYVITLLLGLLLIGVAVRVNRLPADRPRKDPSWMRRVEGMRPGGAAVLGVLLQPWPLVAAGAASVAEADVSNAAQVAQIVAFTVLATGSLLAMEIYTLAAPEASGEKLAGLRGWLDAHRDRAIVILSAVVGVYLVGKGIYNLAQ